jgi:hypothetical protein
MSDAIDRVAGPSAGPLTFVTIPFSSSAVITHWEVAVDLAP